MRIVIAPATTSVAVGRVTPARGSSCGVSVGGCGVDVDPGGFVEQTQELLSLHDGFRQIPLLQIIVEGQSPL